MDSVRLDKWLWAARFFKTRSMAREAVAGGKVRLNGSRAKPAKPLNPGDELRIQRGEEEFIINVVELSERRGPAAIAQGLYEESDENRLRREQLADQRRLQHQQRVGQGRERRPDKRQRRRLIRFKNKYD
jgi:ribosome-associated heat shock protein Hsp15